MPKESKHTEASFSPISTDSLCLLVVQMPRSRDVAIFVPTTDKNDCFTPCACARGNNLPYSRKFWRGIKFGGLADRLSNRQIKIRQNFLLAYIHMAILCRTAKFKSANTFEMAIWDFPPIFPAIRYSKVWLINAHAY